jgi:LmbE family N-acetylglucosaminyl deacetylase
LGFALAGLLWAQAPDSRPDVDDAYRFVAGASEEQAPVMSAVETGVRWSWRRPAASNWDTALLGVRVRAGEDAEPRVEMSAGSTRVTQHLEVGARGLRWLNLTGLRRELSDGVAVEIHGRGATIEPGSARLRIFANGLDLSRRILVLAPHPDDAEIAAFGLYAGRDATIVTVTAGNAGGFNYRANVSDPAEHYLLKGYLRAVDSVTVPWQGGIPPERCFNLGYFDARLVDMRQKPHEPVSEKYGPNQDVSLYRRANIGHLLPTTHRTNTWAHLVEDLAAVLKKVKPDIVVMPHPYLDDHRDHQLVAVAAVEALGRWKKPARFLLYTNHASANRYPFGPAGTVMSLPPWAGPELPVEGIYSHAVSQELQRRKLFALESMHDLRLAPAFQSTCWTPGAEAPREVNPRFPGEDYLVRAVRSEEVFFVFSRDRVRELVSGFSSRANGEGR